MRNWRLTHITYILDTLFERINYISVYLLPLTFDKPSRLGRVIWRVVSMKSICRRDGRVKILKKGSKAVSAFERSFMRGGFAARRSNAGWLCENNAKSGIQPQRQICLFVFRYNKRLFSLVLRERQ